jgi:hypothetical protein
VITLSDDGEASHGLSIPFPTSSGPVGSLWVGANGIVSVATNPTAANYVPDANTFLNSPVTAWYSWHDYNPGEVGSGQVKYHEAVVGSDTIAYITWDGVESYSTPTALNPSTLQFQFNLTTGSVSIVWVTIDSLTTSAYGSGHLIGWSPAGSSANAGSINLATALPIVTASNYPAMALAASPSPVSTPSSGTLLIFTTTNMFEYAPSAGVYIGMHILSLGQIPTGLDLGIIGAPGCKAYVSSLDLTEAMVGFSSTNSVTFPLPAGVPPGFQLYSQSVGTRDAVQPAQRPERVRPHGQQRRAQLHLDVLSLLAQGATRLTSCCGAATRGNDKGETHSQPRCGACHLAQGRPAHVMLRRRKRGGITRAKHAANPAAAPAISPKGRQAHMLRGDPSSHATAAARSAAWWSGASPACCSIASSGATGFPLCT